ncbi:hypothetical protein AOX56_17150 [Aeromonas sobria]|uniref:Uncharacterized protein n=1 Tax=Aeromonas sobria TaxID=646 RepID=A0A2N3IXM4_AERSO|nr:hypothetical protein AOX56_17150 [Aeromonas sobria]
MVKMSLLQVGDDVHRKRFYLLAAARLYLLTLVAAFLLRTDPAQISPHFFLDHDAPTTRWAWHGDRLVVHHIFTMGIAITGVKLLAVAGGSAHQMILATRGAEDLGIITLLQGFDVLTGRIVGAANKQTVTPLLDRQRLSAIGTSRAFEYLFDVAAGWRQGADIITGRVRGAAKKKAMLALAHHQFGPALRARLALEGMFVG